jgi:hypothetical protein
MQAESALGCNSLDNLVCGGRGRFIQELLKREG